MSTLVGSVFTRVTVTEDLPQNRVAYRCVCGTEKTAVKYDLMRGSIKSCGCLRNEATIARNKTSGTRGALTHTYTGRSWNSMMTRCFNPNVESYAAYGGAGITVCQKLKTGPAALIELIGERPNGKSLDRIDTNGSYTCGSCAECASTGSKMNVRWATPAQQCRNQNRNHLVEIDGVTKCIADWSDESGVGQSCIALRIKRGIRGRALLEPANKNHRLVEIGGRVQRLSAWSRESGIPFATLFKRLNNGWPKERLLSPPDPAFQRTSISRPASGRGSNRLKLKDNRTNRTLAAKRRVRR